MKKSILVSEVSEGRARVTLSDEEGHASPAEPMSRERKRVLIKGYAMSEAGKTEVRGSAQGFLIALPVMDGSTPLVSLTLAEGDKQVSLVVDSAGLQLIMRHLLEALKMVTIEMERD